MNLYLVFFSILIFLFILLLLIKNKSSENYISKPQRATQLEKWWEKNKNPTFEKYSMENNSDIVEYSRIKDLKNKGKLSYDNIYKTLL